MLKKTISLLCSLLVLVLCSSYFAKHSAPKKVKLTNKLLNHVRSCVEFNEELENKEDIFALIQKVQTQGYTNEIGNDDLRNKYVFAQGCFEHALACAQAMGDITQLTAVIHTPTIATPLCIKPGEPVEGVLDASTQNDRRKLLTVRARAETLREYLTKGGKLYVVYPEGGQEKRTQEQRLVYQEERESHPDHLIDWTLSCTSMDPDMVGATYFFRDSKKQLYVFSIKSKQAIDIQEKAEWGIWFGPFKDPAISKRANSVMEYLIANGGPDALNSNL